MICRKVSVVSLTLLRLAAIGLVVGFMSLVVPGRAAGQKTKSAPAPKVSAPSKPASTAGHTASGGSSAAHTTTTGSTHPGASNNASSRPAVGTTRTANGGTTTHTASGKEITKSPSGHVTSVKTANGNEAKFDSHGSVKEVHAGNTTVSRGPNGMRRTEVVRADHTRMVAYGHGRGYHGESLGEHGEDTHGYFVYQATLRVPLIFHWPAEAKTSPAQNDEPAALMDVAPTILRFLAIQPPASFQGRSLLPSLHRNSAPRREEIYSESLSRIGTSVPVRCTVSVPAPTSTSMPPNQSYTTLRKTPVSWTIFTQPIKLLRSHCGSICAN